MREPDGMNEHNHEQHGPGRAQAPGEHVQEHDEDQEHGDVDVADPLGWSIVPAGLAGALREVVERHLPPGRAAEAGVATDALVWDLTVAAESWQGGTAPYRPGVVL